MSTGLTDTTPESVNNLGNEILRERALFIVDDPAGATQERLVPFMTFGLLSRLRGEIDAIKKVQELPLPKQCLVALLLASVTGAKAPSRQEAEYIGNAVDCQLRQFHKEWGRAKDAARKRTARAVRAGITDPGLPCPRVRALENKVYVCRYGGTPYKVPVVRNGVPLMANLPVHQQQVPFQVCEVGAIYKQCEILKSQLNRKEEEEIKVDRCRDVQRATAFAEVEQRIRMKAEQKVEQEAHARRLAEAAASEAEKQLRKRQRDAAREAERVQGQLALLGGKVSTALLEAARAAEREERSKSLASRKLEEALEARRLAQIDAEETAKLLKRREREVKQEAALAQAKLARLGGQVSSALVEAARAKEREEKAAKRVKELQSLLSVQRAAAQAEMSHVLALKAQMAKKKRDAERRASTADNLKLELTAARERLRGLRVELSSTKAKLCMEEDDEFNDLGESCAEDSVDQSSDAEEEASAQQALERLRSMPTWQAVHGGGRGAAKMEYGTRLVIYALLSMMVPASAVGSAIVAVLKRTAPWLKPRVPTYETILKCRFELRLVGEALAARRCASAFRIRSIGFDETTKLGNASLTSNVQIEPTEGAQFQDVILRAAYCPLGGTSDMVVKSIEQRCFSRLRDVLRRWRTQFQKMFPEEQWTGPDPSMCSLHRLGGGGGLISDTCNAARCASKLIAQLIAVQVEEHIGAVGWQAMSAAEREAAVRTHPVNCWQHLRNIFLAEMSRAQAKHVQQELQPELDTFASWERMSTDFSQLLRAAFKEFHHSCRYYKGQGRPFMVWLREVYPKAFTLHLERADGGRQDLDYDAAVPLYVDRKYFVEYLNGRVYAKGHKNVLEDFLFVTFTSMQYVAMTRANAIVDMIVSRPMRWLSGKSAQLRNWSPRSMSAVLDLVHEFFERAQHDGSLFLDPALDLFKSIAEQQPLFAEWQRVTFEEETTLSPDGSTRHHIWREVRSELLNPADPTNQRTRQKTIEYLEVQCVAALQKMTDPKLALRINLTNHDGEHSIVNSQQAHRDLMGVHATNDALAEGVFGTYDMILKRCPGISMEAASGVAQAVRSMAFSLGDNVARRKQSRHEERGDYVGYIYTLPEHEQEALVELARITLGEMRTQDRADHAALDDYHKLRRKTNEEEELDALFTRYALALSFFERWVKRGVENESSISAILLGYGGAGVLEQEKLDWLREQIEMRVIGLSWSEWKTPWGSSSDEAIGTVEQLSSHLRAVIAHEKALGARGQLPCKSVAMHSAADLAEECPAPQLRRKTFKVLGQPTAQADALSNDRTQLSPDELLAAAEKRRRELELAGEIDWVNDRQPYPTGQGPILDNTLVGKHLEVRWRYYNPETKQPMYIWCEGEVMQLADGDKDKKSARCKKILPAGAVRIKWAADEDYDENESYTWSILKPSAFNKDVHLGWRFSGATLMSMAREESNLQEKSANRGKRAKK